MTTIIAEALIFVKLLVCLGMLVLLLWMLWSEG